MSLFRNVLGRLTGGAPAAKDAPPSPPPPGPTAAEWRSRGNAALGRGDLGAAADCYRQAAAADPADALAQLNLGFVLLEQGQAQDAQKHLAQALVLRRPDQAILHELHYLLGRACRLQGDAVRAIASFEAAVKAQPEFAEPMEELVQVLHEGGRHEEGLSWARRLEQQRPLTPSRLLVAQELYALRRFDEALRILEGVLAHDAANASAWTGRGNVLLAQERCDEALDAFEHVLRLAGPHPASLTQSALALACLQRHEDALMRLEQALQIDSRHREALLYRVNALLELARADEAANAAAAAIDNYPDDADFHFKRAVALLLGGHLKEGWREHEWRWRTEGGRRDRRLPAGCLQWSGAEELAGRAILLSGEDVGDSLQMLRYVPLVAARGARVLLHLPLPLHNLRLTTGFGPSVTLLPPGEALPEFDYHCPLLSLPLAFASDEQTIPRDVPYLPVDPARAAAWQRRLEAAGPRLKVGIAWSGSATHDNDKNRSIALERFREIAGPGCFFVSLQPQVRASDRPAMADWPDLQRWGEELVDFDDTAALMAGLDLVISVDTSVAHLAGALGRAVWVLLPFCPDWRWMLGRTDSPWYPSATLYRQKQPREWSPALAEVRAALQAWVGRKVPPEALGAVAVQAQAWSELLGRAQSELDAGDPLAALQTLDQADAQAPGHPLSLHLRGNAQFALESYMAAAHSYEAALARKPDLAESAANAATAWFRLGLAEKALESAQRALQINPDHIPALSTRVMALQVLGRERDAIAAARAAHERFPADADLHWIYGATALLAGDFAQGWPALEARWGVSGAGQRPDPAVLGCPLWTGMQAIEGRVLLLVGEQGFGDTLQFARFAATLRQRGARVVLWVQEPLVDLLRGSMPEFAVVSRREPPPAADFHIPMMSLPLALGTTLDTLPADVPYLHADAARVQGWRSRLPRRAALRVGLVWSGNAAHANDGNRSMPIERLQRLLVPGIEFVSLEREPRPGEDELLQRWSIATPAGELDSFADTAALVETLDLVITVDTSVAHLCGALGRPMWVLLAHRPDWRWLLDRDDSPWYPTARLYRQPRPRDWEAVIERVAADLSRWVAAGGAAPLLLPTTLPAPSFTAARLRLAQAQAQGDADDVDAALRTCDLALSDSHLAGPMRARVLAQHARLLARRGRDDEALVAAREANDIDPRAADLALTAALYARMGFGEEAFECASRAVRCNPNDLHARSRELFFSNFCESIPALQVFRRHQEYGQALESAVRPIYEARGTARADPDRKLKVGFVSSDLYRHPVGIFLQPLLEHLDRARLEVHCYSCGSVADELTSTLRAHCAGWTDAQAMTDGELASRVFDDGIDILIDLAGHSGVPRLAAFAQKPAPVQMTWLGYLNTTGLGRIDARLCDERSDPAATQALHTERLLPFSRSQWCYRPLVQVPHAAAAPVAANGTITFGSFNNARKISPAMVGRWARLLRECAGSRIVIADVSSHGKRQAIVQRFEADGVSAQRIRFVPRLDLVGYYRLYNEVDIALDAYPYGGATTTLDALWMGVPVVTAHGELPVSRSASSLLELLGLADWIAPSIDGYVDCALRHARDANALQRCRLDLRQRLQASPLMDEPAFARDFEAAVRAAWARHCAALAATGPAST